MKKIFTLLTISVLSLLMAFAVGCGGEENKGNWGGEQGGEQGGHTHSFTVACAWFDEDHTFVKQYECDVEGCDVKGVEKTAVEISTEEQLRSIAGPITRGELSTSKFLIMNNITLTSAFTPITIPNRAGETFEFASGTTQPVTISNLTVNAQQAGFFGKVSGSLKVKDIHFDNATITGSQYGGVVVGEFNFSAKQQVSIANCDVTNSTVNGKLYAGGVYGTASSTSASSSFTQIDIQDTAVSNTTISSSEGYAGGFAGAFGNPNGTLQTINISINIYTGAVTGCTITSEVTNGAGLCMGYIGYANGILDDSTFNYAGEVSGYKNNTVNGVSMTGVNRIYGKSGWNSTTDKSSVNCITGASVVYDAQYA